jgi:hypothetical protein
VIQCRDCGEAKSETEFYSVKGKPMVRCKACHVSKVAERDARVGDKAERMRRAHLLRTYGITDEEYDDRLVVQEGGCAVCGRPPVGKHRLSVDHNHETGEVRGLLCNPCNSALGRFNDDPERLLAAWAYLTAGRTFVMEAETA